MKRLYKKFGKLKSLVATIGAASVLAIFSTGALADGETLTVDSFTTNGLNAELFSSDVSKGSIKGGLFKWKVDGMYSGEHENVFTNDFYAFCMDLNLINVSKDFTVNSTLADAPNGDIFPLASNKFDFPEIDLTDAQFMDIQELYFDHFTLETFKIDPVKASAFHKL